MRLVLDRNPEVPVPFLYEVWNWVGDKSILPTKWFELLKKHDNQNNARTFSHITKEKLVNEYVKDPRFDANGFFFLTTRSETVCGVLVWPVNDSTCEFVALASLPGHRDKNTTQATVSLAIDYAIRKGYSQALYNEAE